MELRPYQLKAVESVLKQWEEGNKRTLLVLPTGTGKTICFAKIAEHLVREGKRVLILAHRQELLQQAMDKIKTATGLDSSLEMAENRASSTFDRIVVGSVQTLMRESRLNTYKPDFFDAIIVDEAHHCLSDSYQVILNYFEGANVLGVTATADRMDKRELGEYFDTLAYEYLLPDAIREGYLSPIVVQTIPLEIDLTAVKVTAGDFQASDLGRALDPYLDMIADEMVNYCEGRKTVVFLPLIETSQRFTQKLIDRGFVADEVNGNSKDRTEILTKFNNGQIEILCNSMLLTEGWDCPSVDCIICLRPTKSRSLYTQIIGRGTRLSPGKENLLVLDFLWHIEKHQLCKPYHLMAKDDAIAKRMALLAGNRACDLMDLEQEAEREAAEEREKTLQAELEKMRKRKKRLVDPLQYEFSIQDSALQDYVPSFGWESKSASEGQIKALEKFGIDASPDLIAGKASLLLDRLIKRARVGLSSPKQIRCLERYGFLHVGQWTKEEASKCIADLAARQWKAPQGMIDSYNKRFELRKGAQNVH